MPKYIMECDQFYQAFPHISTASDKRWGEKVWVQRYPWSTLWWCSVQVWSAVSDKCVIQLSIINCSYPMLHWLATGLGSIVLSGIPVDCLKHKLQINYFTEYADTLATQL